MHKCLTFERLYSRSSSASLVTRAVGAAWVECCECQYLNLPFTTTLILNVTVYAITLGQVLELRRGDSL